MPISAIPRAIILLTLSNVFMTFAWYAHLKNLSTRPWWIATPSLNGERPASRFARSDSWHSTAVRSAFSGSSGSARLVPQVTIIPSPRYLSTVPPKRSTIGTKSSNTA